MNRARSAVGQFNGTAESLRRVFDAACRDIVDNLQVTRASIWFLTPKGDAIVCDSLFDSRSGIGERGVELRRSDYPEYFDAIAKDEKIIASDAASHPATACFQDSYFRPNDIHSLLDHIVIVENLPVAILCCEQCGSVRRWTDVEELYLYQMATLIGIAFQTRLTLMG
jgi:GAF domain-containing protein